MILARYIFREVISSTLLGTSLATFVVFLQGSRRIFELLISSSARPRVAAKVFALALPQLLPLTIPFGVLVGILIGLGRMSSDGEITAMRRRRGPQPEGDRFRDDLRTADDDAGRRCFRVVDPRAQLETYRC